MEMTPRNRVLSAVGGNEVYPVPVDVFENGIYPRLESRLLDHFNLAAGNHEGLLCCLRSCLRWGKPPYIGPALETDASLPADYPIATSYRGIWGTWEGPMTYFDGLDRPLRDARSTHEIDQHDWPDPAWFDYDRIGWFWNETDTCESIETWATRHSAYARVLGSWSPVFSRVMDLFGMETGLQHLALRPDLIHATVSHIGDFTEEYYLRLASTGRGRFDFLGFGDDFASQDRLLVRPEKWREYFLPLWRRLFAIAHANDMKPLLHACGSVRAVMPDLVDAGLAVLEVVQVTAAGMDPIELKREFGKDLTFYGGLEVQQLMPRGNVADVRREVRRLVDILAKGGGYIASTTHFLMDDVPPENVLALHEEAGAYCPR